MKRIYNAGKQQESFPNFTKYCACHAKWISSLIHITYETSFPMRRASKVNGKWISSLIRVTYERSFPMRGASKVTLETHQVLRLPRNLNLEAQDFSWNSWSASANTKTIRPHSDHIPTIIFQNVTTCCACHKKSHSNFTKYCACRAKLLSWSGAICPRVKVLRPPCQQKDVSHAGSICGATLVRDFVWRDLSWTFVRH